MKADPSKDVPTKSSTGAEWQNWFSECYDSFGVKIARQLFFEAWKVRGTTNANTADLRAYLKKYGIDLAASNIFGTIVDTGDGILDKVGGFLNMGKYVTIGVMSVIGISVIVIAIGIAKNPKVIGDAAKMAAI